MSLKKWLEAFAGLFIFSFFMLGVWSGAKIMENNTDTYGVMFVSAIILMMLREAYWGIKRIMDSFEKPSPLTERKTK